MRLDLPSINFRSTKMDGNVSPGNVTIFETENTRKR